MNLAAAVAEPIQAKAPDPWFLITNLDTTEEAIFRYHEWFQIIEEWFKDLKHQLGLAIPSKQEV